MSASREAHATSSSSSSSSASWRHLPGGIQSLANRYNTSRNLENDLDALDADDFQLKSRSEQHSAAIEPENVGFRLLVNMGWEPNTGLGRNRQGIREPISLKTNAPFNGATWGLGLDDLETKMSSEATARRKTLETELQLQESEDQLIERVEAAEKKRKIELAVKNELKEFFCDLCKKQYSKAVDFERHLGSYDHNHKKRLSSMKDSSTDVYKASKSWHEKEIERRVALAQTTSQKEPDSVKDASEELLPPGTEESNASTGPSVLPADRKPVAISFGLGSKKAGSGRGRFPGKK